MSNLEDIICEAIQDDCVRHCNHPYCYKVNNIVTKLKENNVHFDMPADKVYATKELCEQDIGEEKNETHLCKNSS